MPSFDLRTSPFYVLGVSPRDDPIAIEDAKEAAISDGRLSETEALGLQQTLMAPRRRLGAELGWLLGVAPNRARKLIEESSLSADEAAGLPSLAAANIAAHRCAQKLAPAHPDLLMNFYARNEEEEALNLLNSERRTSGFPEVSRDLIRESLQELTHAHIAALLTFITDQPNPGRTLLEILQKHFIDGSNVVSFLDELVDRFDEWAADPLRNFESAITKTLECVRENPASLDEQLPSFSLAIGGWASTAAPRQFIMARRHLKDPRTDRLFPKIRGVGLHLHNELGDPVTPLAITNAAIPAFEGSPDHIQQLRADRQTLEELAASHGALKIVEPLLALVNEVGDKKNSELCTSIRRGDFKRDGLGLAGNLYRLFEKAQQDLIGDAARAAPFRIILSLAIDLNNQSQATEEALILLRALQAVSDVPADVADRLRENAQVAHQTYLQKQLSTAVKGQRVGRSAKLAKELEESSTDAEDRAGWRTLRQQLERRRNVQWAKWIGWPAVVGGIILAASLSDNKSTSPSGRSSTYTAPTARPADVFTASEIQSCVFEDDRLKRLRVMIGETPPNSIAVAINARYADWNSKCLTKKYYQSDYDAAERALQASSASQQADALALYRSWSAPAPRLVPGMNK